MFGKATFNIRVIYLLIVSMLCLVSITYADGLGTGDGSGGGSDVALTLVSSAPENGATEVMTNTTIELLFNKNVVNLAIQDVNRNAISMKDEAGTPIAVDILFPDDQIDRDHRRNIYIDPVENLQPNTEYHIYIDRSFMAKNGSQIDKVSTVTLTTAGVTEMTLSAPEQVPENQQKDRPENITDRQNEQTTDTPQDGGNVSGEPNSVVSTAEQQEVKDNEQSAATNSEQPETSAEEDISTTIDMDEANKEISNKLTDEKASDGFSSIYGAIIVVVLFAIIALIISIKRKTKDN